jgi:ribonucleases P/MRP protein subunit RPP40
MEYSIQVWSLHLVKNVQILEKVQRRATKLMKELQKLSYGERLTKLGLTTLEARRQRGDLEEAYKILTGKNRIKYEQFF